MTERVCGTGPDKEPASQPSVSQLPEAHISQLPEAHISQLPETHISQLPEAHISQLPEAGTQCRAEWVTKAPLTSAGPWWKHGVIEIKT